MDVNFDEFRTRAEVIVKKATAISVNAIRETIREDDEEVKELQRERGIVNKNRSNVEAEPKASPQQNSTDSSCNDVETRELPAEALARNINSNNWKERPLSNGQREETDKCETNKVIIEKKTYPL